MDMRARLNAAEGLLKRYRGNPGPNSKEECFTVISSEKTTMWQKRAARILLNFILGVKQANDVIESFAIVTDRNDSLVFRWKQKVIQRDGLCTNCGSDNKLHAHHISHWSDDPVNRINLDNGITLCAECHSEEHPELEKTFITGR